MKTYKEFLYESIEVTSNTIKKWLNNIEKGDYSVSMGSKKSDNPTIYVNSKTFKPIFTDKIRDKIGKILVKNWGTVQDKEVHGMITSRKLELSKKQWEKVLNLAGALE